MLLLLSWTLLLLLLFVLSLVRSILLAEFFLVALARLVLATGVFGAVLLVLFSIGFETTLRAIKIVNMFFDLLQAIFSFRARPV